MVKREQKKRRVYIRGYESMSTATDTQSRSVKSLRKGHRVLGYFLTLVAIGLVWLLLNGSQVVNRQTTDTRNTNLQKTSATSGKVVEQGEVISYTSEQTLSLIRQTDKSYTGAVEAVQTQLFRYTVNDPNGSTVQVYARVYLPSTKKTAKFPIFAFAPGTTGIDDSCASSVEQSSKRAWGNYPSHLAAYAAQGYAVVITDYEGMRDSARMHHYMVGNLEGRAVIDSIRSLSNLPLTKDRVNSDQIIVGGYSQGGHAAFWADEIAPTYAPDLVISGVVGFGPVTDVRQTLTDTTRGANILWFGPYLLYSYSDWYKESYPVDKILQPPFAANLSSDIAANCIDTNIAYWGNKDINKVYTQGFIEAMKTGSVSSVSKDFDARMRENLTADVKTTSKKLINHGKLDNVVLMSQSDVAAERLCSLGNNLTYRKYSDATHYNTMTKSFADTLNWMKLVWAKADVVDTCP
jgi:pimeloyl-ACP methyl ester carboxylesterase